jgi:hypothetical protein
MNIVKYRGHKIRVREGGSCSCFYQGVLFNFFNYSEDSMQQAKKFVDSCIIERDRIRDNKAIPKLTLSKEDKIKLLKYYELIPQKLKGDLIEIYKGCEIIRTNDGDFTAIIGYGKEHKNQHRCVHCITLDSARYMLDDVLSRYFKETPKV